MVRIGYFLSFSLVAWTVALPSPEIKPNHLLARDSGNNFNETAVVHEAHRLSGNQNNVDPLPQNRTSIGEKPSPVFSTEAPYPIDDDTTSQLKLAADYTKAVYCPKPKKGVWEYGPAGDRVGSDTKILWTFGDGQLDPPKILTWNEERQELTFITRGTNSHSFISILNDAFFIPITSASTFPAFFKYAVDLDGGPLSDLLNALVGGLVAVHSGFYGVHRRAYTQSLEQLRHFLTVYPQAKRVRVLGHSLGCASATLDAITLRGDLDPKQDPPIEFIGFGCPRVFNPIGARLLSVMAAKGEEIAFSYTHVHNSQDIVPHLAPLVLGFEHASHEIFLRGNGTDPVFCPGTENLNCSLGQFNTSGGTHLGPYFSRIFDEGYCSYQ